MELNMKLYVFKVLFRWKDKFADIDLLYFDFLSVVSLHDTADQML